MTDQTTPPSEVPKRGHILTIKPPQDVTDPDWADNVEWDIECLGNCGCWISCSEKHEVDGRSAESGPYACDVTEPWCDQEEYEFHGVVHTWHYGYDWTVPYDGCGVVGWDSGVEDSVYEIAIEHGPGRYKVDDAWDEHYCTLAVIQRLPLDPDQLALPVEGS